MVATSHLFSFFFIIIIIIIIVVFSLHTYISAQQTNIPRASSLEVIEQAVQVSFLCMHMYD
jgi:hypothetical protein